MCTMICLTTSVRGSAKGPAGWFTLSQANVGYDHAIHAPFEHALLLDFVNPELGVEARVGVELSLASGKALLEQLRVAIDEAERSGVAE
jgi:hypothetical protein